LLPGGRRDDPTLAIPGRHPLLGEGLDTDGADEAVGGPLRMRFQILLRYVSEVTQDVGECGSVGIDATEPLHHGQLREVDLTAPDPGHLLPLEILGQHQWRHGSQAPRPVAFAEFDDRSHPHPMQEQQGGVQIVDLVRKQQQSPGRHAVREDDP
jgi:hypothetical protein